MEIPCTLTFTTEEQFLIDKIRNVIKDVSEVEVVANLKMKQEDSRDSSPRPKMRKLDPDEQVLSNTHDNDWVRLDAHRVLKTSERDVILQNKKLDDLVINFAQILLKRQLPSMNGLFSTLLLTTLSPFGGWQENFLQICHYQAWDHWITVSTKDCKAGEIMIYDSFYNDVDPVIASTLERLFNIPLTYKMAVVGKQEGGVDCGVFTIANATAIALRDSVTPLPKFDQEKIRPYLASCLEMKCFNAFPEICN